MRRAQVPSRIQRSHQGHARFSGFTGHWSSSPLCLITAASLSPSEDCVGSMVHSTRSTSLFPSSRIKLSQAVAVLRAISSANDDASVGKMAQESYDRTLAKHHPWLIRKGASLAMLTLPKVDEIFAKALPDEKKDLRQLVSSVSEEAYKVYNFTQTVYEQKNLLNLP
ncbi:ceramide-1-phosphate transfer protein isoform X3 [Dermacentor andersoni]|uniref:ceramide-1-phosphate transfer protein isoform X3 n=1 Tax=Dermacentor andersoni TaxID=34620 RepID=UPI003B3A848B